MDANDLYRNLITLMGKTALGETSAADFVAWAVERLVAGDDTPALCVLAGEPASAYTEDALVLFRKALRELHLPFPPDKQTALLRYVRQISEDLLADRVSAIDACERIYRIALYTWIEAPTTIELHEWDRLATDLHQLDMPSKWQYLEHPDLTRENFTDYAKATARAFLARPLSEILGSPRAGWSEGFAEMARVGDDALLDSETQFLTEWEATEWEW